MAWWIQLKCDMGCALPKGNYHIKMDNFWSGTTKLQMHENGIFLVPVNTHLLNFVARAYLAAQHTSAVHLQNFYHQL